MVARFSPSSGASLDDARGGHTKRQQANHAASSFSTTAIWAAWLRNFLLLEGRTLNRVGATSQRGQWSGGLTILNALNKEYILAAGSRGAVTVGTPRNLKASITYKF